MLQQIHLPYLCYKLQQKCFNSTQPSQVHDITVRILNQGSAYLHSQFGPFRVDVSILTITQGLKTGLLNFFKCNLFIEFFLVAPQMRYFMEDCFFSPYTPQHLRSYYCNAEVFYSLVSPKVITCPTQPYILRKNLRNCGETNPVIMKFKRIELARMSLTSREYCSNEKR